jgi:hypothetical protein
MCTSLVKTVFDVHMHDMNKEGKLEELWKEHVQSTATVFCQGGSAAGGDSSSGDSSTITRQRDRFLHEDDYTIGNAAALPDEDSAAATAADEGRHVRRLSQSGGSFDGENISQTTQLTLKNMGGVFLLHAILSGLSLLCALISWYHKPFADHYKKATSAARKSNKAGADGGGVDADAARNEPSMTNKDLAASSIDQDEFFDASATQLENGSGGSGTTPMENGSGRKNGNNDSSSLIVAVDDLRMDMKQKLKSIDQKLAALLDRQHKIVC